MLAPENLLLKTMKLARIMENEPVQKYLKAEMYGSFPLKDKNIEWWVQWVGRMTDTSKELGYWETLAGIYARIEATQNQLQALRVPDLSYASSVCKFTNSSSVPSPDKQDTGCAPQRSL